MSGALALFSALPLSTNPTERRWLFTTSTVAVVAASWEAGVDSGGPDVAVALAACVSVKVLLFTGMDLACPKWNSNSQCGFDAFSFDVDESKQRASWNANGGFCACRQPHRP